MIIPNHMTRSLGQEPTLPGKDDRTPQTNAQLEVGKSLTGKSNPPYQIFGGKRK